MSVTQIDDGLKACFRKLNAAEYISRFKPDIRVDANSLERPGVGAMTQMMTQKITISENDERMAFSLSGWMSAPFCRAPLL